MIREATLDDLESIVKLEETFGAEAFTRRSLRYLIKKQTTLVIDIGEIIGYSTVLARKNSARARLYSIAIARPYRGNGHGQALLEASESLAIRMGRNKMCLEVAENNRVALGLYEARGYKLLKRLPNYYSDGTHALRLLKAF
jgi:ribosomal protein S18 acetylase RimI-like enzyme